METPLILLVILIVIISIFFSSLKIVQEYERGVIFRLGRLLGVKGPGWFFIIPFGIDRYVKVDLRTVTMEVPTQETITRDNVSVKVNAVLYFRVADPTKSVVNVIDFIRATLQISQTTLRSVIGQSDLDDLLSRRDKINESLQKIIDTQTEPWGIKVSSVEVKDVELPQSMQRAMARQAEAEREKRAKIISAEGELMASEKLAEAAHIMGQEKQTMQLRYLQTLSEISVEKNSTIIFPLPIELMNFLGSKFDSSDSPAIKTDNEKRVVNEVTSTQRQARKRGKETLADGEIKE
ncbi:MAG: slipin family protein [Chloroflexi bacterium]|uniref:Slipin family protein n=1 Tax=Candidatus Chlorohelix allophototropha TaxID=3003348 RepID=A0A8T7M131_9CHLR|nr:slipin family protein [Chloroflexota bacterium]WJW65952.1 slipin family protein [Chloroflexota bacterium L227-S17]